VGSRPVVEAENRLDGFNRDRDRLVRTVATRVMAALQGAAAAGGEASLEYVLNDVAQSELARLERAGGRRKHKDGAAWRELSGKLGAMAEGEKRERLAQLVARYAADVAGNFNPRVYRFAKEILPTGLGLAFAPVTLTSGLAGARGLSARVHVDGPIDHIRSLCERGTLVVTPTHSSNMDSIVLGVALLESGLPPVTYGAGKNLFANKFLGFFMHNLGAYRVDRRLTFRLYKDVLKEYSTVLLENGYHSLFFPGGTRSRSNQVESKLKLGLLGTANTAYQNLLRDGDGTRRIYVVPATINYHLVLEAETLIGDYLAEVGRSRYIIEDDEFSRLGRMVEFLRRVLALEESVVIRFGDPLDPFGNRVDEAGESVDGRGRRVDPASFVRGSSGELAIDPQRDQEYTRQLGAVLTESYRRDTAFLSTHLAARVLYDLVSARAGTDDIYRLLRPPDAALTVPRADAERAIDRLRARIAAKPAHGSVYGRAREWAPLEVVDDALRALGTYHLRKVAWRAGDAIRVGSMRLLYYYRNRTAHIGPEVVA
jgi:glycerol-3-phosphate O-acyltransferase